MNSRRVFVDVIDALSYNAGYAAGYLEGKKDGTEIGYKSYVRRKRRREIREKELRREKIFYFWTSKLMGVLLLCFSIFTTIVLEGDATFSVISVPLGLYLIFCKNFKEMEEK